MTLVNEKKPAKKIEKKRVVQSERSFYRKLKAKIFELEKDNNQYIYLYRSSKDWWKLGGYSALFYKYKIAPILKFAVELHKDNDHYDTFPYGTISIRNLADFEKRMEKAGLKPHEKNSDNVKRYEFKKKIDLSTIEAIKADLEFQHDRMNRLVETHKVAPDMYILIRKFMSEFWYYAKKYNKNDSRRTVSNEVIKEMIKMKRLYSHIANGDMEVKKGMVEIRIRADALISDIAFLEEIQEMGFDKAIGLCTYLGDIKRMIDRELKKVIKEEETRESNFDGR